MEEEKEETKKGKGTNFLTLVIFTIIVVIATSIVLAIAFREKYNGRIVSLNDFKHVEITKEAGKPEKQKENIVIEEELNHQEETINYKDAYNKVHDEEYITNMIDNYSENEKYKVQEITPYSTAKYYLYDIDNDEEMECLVIYEGRLSIYHKDETGIIEIYDDSLTVSFGFIGLYEIKNNDTGETELLSDVFTADGLCFEAEDIAFLKYENGELVFKNYFGYSCDQEEEERKRNSVNENETNKDLACFHTLEYWIDDDKVSLEEYQAHIEELNNQYTLIFKTDEELDLFK